jgi:hypothetical protein
MILTPDAVSWSIMTWRASASARSARRRVRVPLAGRLLVHGDERVDELGFRVELGQHQRLVKGQVETKNRFGKHFVNFTPAVSDDAKKRIGKEIRSWRINCRSDKTLSDLARMFNPHVHGWLNYYGRFYKSMLFLVLRRINEYLVRWAMRKYKRLRGHYTRTVKWLANVARREPRLFAHWRVGVLPDGWTMGAR